MSTGEFPGPTDESYETTADDRLWATMAHLSSLIAMWLGGLSFLGPLIVWLLRKDQSRFVDDQGKEALNFQLTVFLAMAALALVALPLVFLTMGFALVLIIPALLVLVIVQIILPIVAALKANSGEYYRYPCTLRLIS